MNSIKSLKMSKEIGEEYSSSLADLTINSKPLINMLTILAEEGINHADVIVQSVEKHLDEVHPDIKLPVLYLVDSIIKNVGGPYTQLFSQIIVNMFCRVFKQVDEKTRSQMFKLRETWHDVFPSIKLYQLDVKVNLIDPAWPIQAQPPQQNTTIHLNPNFLLKNSSTPVNTALLSSTSGAVTHTMTPEEEEMRNAVALKEQELLLLQKKKIEMELEHAKKLLEQSKTLEKKSSQPGPTTESHSSIIPSAVVAVPPRLKKGNIGSSGQSSVRIAPISPALLNHTRRRDPRLIRNNSSHISLSDTVSSQAVNSFDIKHSKLEKNKLGKISEHGNEMQNKDDKSNSRHFLNKKDPRLNRNKTVESPTKSAKSSSTSPASSSSKRSRSPVKSSVDHRLIDKKKKSNSPDVLRNNNPHSNKLPPIPKIKPKVPDCDSISPLKSKKDVSRSERNKKSKSQRSKRSRSPNETSKKAKFRNLKYKHLEPLESSSPPHTDVTFKELKVSTKERNYIRRNREKSESPEKSEVNMQTKEVLSGVEIESCIPATVSSGIIGNGVTKKDVDLRLIAKCPEITPQPVTKKRLSSDKREDSPVKKSKTEKFDALFGDEDVDLRKFPLVENLTPPPPPIISSAISEEKSVNTEIVKDLDGGWAKVKEVQSPHPTSAKSHLAEVRAKLAEATRGKDPLGRPLLYTSNSLEDDNSDISTLISEDTDMRLKPMGDLDNDAIGTTIKTILTQAEENLMSGEMNKQQYNDLLRQVLQISEAQKLKEAQQKDSLEMSKRKLNWMQKKQAKQTLDTMPCVSDEDDVQCTFSPQSDDVESNDGISQNIAGTYGDIDERVVPPMVNMINNVDGGKRPPLLPRPDMPFLDSDLRMQPHSSIFDKQELFANRNSEMRFPNRYPNPRLFPIKGWRGMRPKIEERGVFRGMPTRGLLPPPMLSNRRMMNPRLSFEPNLHPSSLPFASKGPFIGMKQMNNPLPPYLNSGKMSPPPLGTAAATKGFSPIDSKILQYIDQDTMRTIHIDGTAREIRYYDKTAVIMLNWDDPREISFEPGRRRIFFDDESFILNLNEDYVNFTIDGQPHRIRFGAPTRELFIDDAWFECFFGGPPMPILLDNKVKYLKLEGPPPQVSIGKIKRTDLVAGKINLIIDATMMHPVFLDAKLQKFDIENVTHTLRFVDSLQTILINETPFKVEFGGLPKPLFVGRRKHFVRFSVLPRDIKAGLVNIKDMEGKKPPILLAPPEFNIGSGVSISNQSINSSTENSMSVTTSNSDVPLVPSNDTENVDTEISGGLDMLASVIPSSMAPASQFAGYSVMEPTIADNMKQLSVIPGLENKHDMSVPPPNISSLLQNINVNDLFAKLVESGIVSALPAVTNQKSDIEEITNAPSSSKQQEKNPGKNIINVIKHVDIMKSETLKVKQPGLITLLHTGMQCGGCGARFPPEHTVRYSQHLDWHFRQNRADRHSQRKPNSRRWYYDISDWIQYQEIEDLEEREKSWFEREQQAAEAARSEEAAAVAARRETSSVPLKSGAPAEQLRCHLCHDSFHQFYNHDTDEWHLKNAVEHEANNYHPICLDDYKASLIKEQEKPSEDEDDKTFIELDKENVDSEVNEVEDLKNLEASDAQENDNVDEEESIVEVLSEETGTQGSTVDDIPDVEVVEEDDDVVIKNEPVEQIIVDDVDTDEETEKERQNRDAQSDIPVDFANIKIKQEPIDPDDEPIITSEEVITAQVDTTHAAVLSSIDGNVQLEPTVQTAPTIPAGGIRINIAKPLMPQPREKESAQPIQENAVDEPLPPGEEPTYKLKSSLEEVSFSIQPPTNRGSELSGLCSVM